MKDINSKQNDKSVIIPFSDLFTPIWDMWKEYKKDAFNFVYKGVYSEQMTLKQLVELSDGDEQKATKIIEQSIRRQWQGLFPLHETTKSNGTRTKKSSSTKDETGSGSTLRERVQAEFNRRNGNKGYENGESHLKAV